MAAHPRPVTYRISAQFSGTGGLVADVYQTFPRPFLTAHLDDGVMETVVTNWGNDGIGIEMAGPGLAGNWLPGLGPMQFLPIGPLFIRDSNNLLSIDFSGLQSQINATNTALAANSAADAIWRARLVTDESQISANAGALAAQQAAISALQSAMSVANAQILGLQQQIAALTNKLYPTAEALLQGVGGLLAKANLLMQSSAQLAGTGGLAAQLGLVTTLAPFQFAGSGGMAVALYPLLAAQATLQGSGSMAAALIGNLPIAASLAGSGSLAAALVTNFSLSASLAGSGGLTATLFRPIFLDAITLAGTGSLAASLGNLMALSGITGPNAVLNPSGSGAVTGTPGTLPVPWTRIAAGLTVSIPVIGTDAATGIPYIDFGFTGTGTGTTATVTFGVGSGVNLVPALPGQNWTASIWFGITTDDPDITTHQLAMYALNTSGVGIQTSLLTLPRTTGFNKYYLNSNAAFPAGTVGVLTRYIANFPASASLNFTVRIGIISAVQDNPPGAGGLTANLTQFTPANLWPIAASLTGTGVAAIDSLQSLMQTNALLAGSGGLSAVVQQNLMLSAITGPNQDVNTAASGAVIGTPGTLPTNWTHGALAGVAISVINLGTDSVSGVNFVDVGYAGTATSGTSQYVEFGVTSGAGSVAAAPGQLWTALLYFALLVDDPDVTSHQFNLLGFNSGGGITQTNTITLPRTVGPTLLLYQVSSTAFPANTVTVATRYTANYAASSALNFSVRLGGPTFARINPPGTGGMVANITGGH